MSFKISSVYLINVAADKKYFSTEAPTLWLNKMSYRSSDDNLLIYDDMAGVEVNKESELPEGMYRKVVPKAEYAVFTVNGNNANGEIVMNPMGHEHYKHPDPFNGSADCLPKIGVSLGYRFFDPAKHRRGGEGAASAK